MLPLAEEGLSPDASGAEVSPTAGNVLYLGRCDAICGICHFHTFLYFLVFDFFICLWYAQISPATCNTVNGVMQFAQL